MYSEIPPAAEIFSRCDNRFVVEGVVGDLELLTRKGDGQQEALADCLVIVCHPHPEHGGTMDNKVVTTVARAARESGLDSLRFNYRGVGKSEGSYGEFDGECEDFDRVIEWVLSETDKRRLMLVGFSFGSAIVGVRANKVSQNIHSILIAPPVEVYSYPASFTVPVTVIQGADDEVVDADKVTDWVRSLSTAYEYYYSGQTSHFFHGKLIELRQKLCAIFSAVTD